MHARCDGADIFYEDVGAGTPVLLVHGFPHDHHLWAPQLAGLVDCCRAIAPDLRGFGASAPASSASMGRWADDLACVLDHAGVDSAVVAGLSMGGYVAFEMWRRHPGRVRALVLADTRAGADSEEARENRRTMIALARDRGADAVAERMITGMVGKSTRERSPHVVEEVRRMLARQPVEGIIAALEAMMARPDSTPTLATITVPALVVVGDEDALTPPAEARALAAHLPRATVEVLQGAGHVSNLERPAAFNRVLSEFVAGVGGA